VRGEPRSVKIAALQTPQDKAVLARCLSLLLQRISGGKPSGDRGGEPGGSGAIFLIGSRPEDFVQRASGEPTARQGRIERGDAKRQHSMMQRIRPLNPADALLQIDKLSRRWH
jgi:hypothetical protein